MVVKKYLPPVLLGVAVYLAFLVIDFPAAQAYRLVKAVAPQAPLILKGVQGTLWSGSASEALVAGQVLSSLEWEIKPLWLLLGRVQMHLGMRQGQSYFYGDVGRSLGNDIHLANVEANLVLADLRVLSTVIPVQLSGALSLNLQELDFENRLVSAAQGVIAWQDAGLASMQNMNFGNLRIELQNAADGVTGKLSDSGGPLQAEGTLQLADTGSYQFNGAFLARDSAQSGLAQSLRFLGQPGADGRISVARTGNLADLGGIFAKPAGT